MDFKIDTKDTFSVITPLTGGINANLAVELAAKIEELRQNGSKNYIVDLGQVNVMGNETLQGLVELHEACYGNEESLVFTGVSANVMRLLKADETDLLLNIAPKMAEAIDIISMEILEREMFGEE